MNNVLYEELPTEWNGYELNTWFQIGVQLALLFEDDEMSDYEKHAWMIELLFGNIDGTIREYPQDIEELNECISWFMGGWNHDNLLNDSDKEEKLMDYYVDQGRIYADFIGIYGINLNESTMHWWEFQWLLWNMPHERSSFLQTIEIRTKKPRKGSSPEEIKAIQKGKKIYGLKQKEKELSQEQVEKIDAYDLFMKKIKKGE